MDFNRKTLVLALLLVLGSAASAVASGWVGENGLVRLSFAEGKEIQSVKTQEAGDGGLTLVDLYAYLTDVDPVKLNGEVFLGLGALEMTLKIEGAEGSIVKQEIPAPNHSLGRGNGEIISGLPNGIILEEDATLLVHWQIMFKGKPENVVFCLDLEGGITRFRSPDVKAAQPYALYTGRLISHQQGTLFGAGCVPAYLNFTGQPDLTPLHTKESWQDIGVYEKR